MRNLLILLFSLLTIGGLTGCGSSAPILKPFKMDIQQGNVVTSKMLLQLKPGMTKSQVRFIMGTPLIVDSFHKDRWDYFYQMRHAGKVIEQRRVILEFEKDLLTRVRGDVVPAGTAGADAGDASVSKTIVMPAKKPVEKSWTEKLKFWKKDDKVPEAKPVEAPKAVMPEPVAPESANPEMPATEDVPSVLAVPIGVGAPEAAVPTVETPPVELPKPEPVKPEPPKAIEISKPEVPKPAEAPKVAPPAPAPNKPVAPAPQAPSSKQDDKMIFRMDRTLDPKQLEQETAPKAAEPVVEKPAVEQAVKPKKKAVDAPLPEEIEPGFFDRMLEKIGF